MKIYLFLLFLALALLHVASAKRIAVVGAQSDKLLLTVQAAVQDIYSATGLNSTVFQTPEVLPVWLSGNATNRLAQARTAAADPELFLALVASNDASIASAFSDTGVIVMMLNPPSEPGAVPSALNLEKVSAPHLAVARLFERFGWNATALVFTPTNLNAALQLRNALGMTSPSVSIPINATIDASFSATVFSSVISNLERSTTRVVTVVGDAETVGRLFSAIRDTRFEFVVYDPSSTRDDHLSVGLAGLYRPTIAGVPRGFFVVAPDEDVSNLDALSTRLNALNASVFAGAVDSVVIRSYDAIFLMANAIVDVFNAGGSAVDPIAVRDRIFAAPRAYVGGYSFDAATSSRLGNMALWNLKVTNASASQSSWSRVGSWTGSGTFSIPNPSLLTFADGLSTIPGSSQRPTVSIGYIWPNLRATHTAWRIIAQLAVNEINANSSFMPNGLVVRGLFADNLDSASSTILAGQELLQRGVVGVIGPARSSQAIALQYYYGGLSVPAVSFASTLDALSDKVNYPTFFRTIVRDSLQSKSMAALIANRGWRSLCVINFNDDYGSAVASSLVVESQLLNLTVVGRSVYSSSTNDFDAVVSPIASAGCRIIVGILDTANFGPLLRLAKAKGIFGEANPGYVWIFSEIFGSALNRPSITGANLTLADFQGTLITRPVDGPLESPRYQSVSSSISAALSREGIAVPGFSTQLYDAVLALAHATANVYRAGRDPLSDRTALLTSLRQVSFEGASGPVQFDQLQDRLGGIYGFYNFRSSAAAAVYVGTWSASAGVVFATPIIYGDNTTNVPPDRFNLVLPALGIRYSTVGGGIIIAIAIAVLLCIIGTAIYIFYKAGDENDQMAVDIVRKSSPVFLGIIMFGLALSVISVFFWFSPTDAPTGSARCHLRVWFGFIGAAIAYSALLAKNWRVFYLFNEPSLRVIAITNQTLITILALVVSPLAIVLVLWSSLAPFQEVLQNNASNTLSYYTCVSTNDKLFAGISFAYMGILLVFGSILSWKTRSLPDVFKESQYIALATYNILFITAVGVLVGFIVSFEPPAYTFIIVVCILIGAAATWALIFINKFYIMKYGPPSSRSPTNTTTHSGPMSGMSKNSLSYASQNRSESGKYSKSSHNDESSEQVEHQKGAKAPAKSSKTSSKSAPKEESSISSSEPEEESEEDSDEESSEEEVKPQKSKASNSKPSKKQQSSSSSSAESDEESS